jgi:uncharacterized integral membrane protein
VRYLKWITLGFFSLVLLTFALSNRQPVALSFFPFESRIELPLYLFFFVTLIAGVLMGGLFTLIEKVREMVLLKKKDHAIRALKNEVEALKAEKKIAEGPKKSKTGPVALTQV